MILKNLETGKCYHTIWTEIRAWSTATCYDDKSKIKVKRTSKIAFIDESGSEYLRTTAKEIQAA